VDPRAGLDNMGIYMFIFLIKEQTRRMEKGELE
jgi:hypothetical protein